MQNHRERLLGYSLILEKFCDIFQECFPANIYLFKVNNRNTRKKGVKYVQKHQNEVSDVVLAFLLLTLKIFHTFF